MRELQTEDFYPAAYSYLDEWMLVDRTIQGDLEDREHGHEHLYRFANYYRVSRTIPGEGPDRFRVIWQELVKVPQPTSDRETIDAVEQYAKRIQILNGGLPTSAASKFLWARFRHPVVMFDSNVRQYLVTLKAVKDGDSYSYQSFFNAWRGEFEKNQGNIETACIALFEIKKFTRAKEDPDLLDLLKQRWFHQRVFDHYMLDQAD
jgi:hypothetical protein